MPPWFTQSWMRIRTSCRNLSSSIPISIVASTGLNRYTDAEKQSKPAALHHHRRGRRAPANRTVRRLIRDGELNGYRMGSSLRVIRVDLHEIDDQLMRPMNEPPRRRKPRTS